MKVVLLMATTIDGKIAKTSDEYVDWTGKEDKKYFMNFTKEAGVVIMGSKTFATMEKPLPGRLNVVMSRKYQCGKIGSSLIFTTLSPSDIISSLSICGYETIVIAGGQKINTLFLKENLIDEIHMTIVPKIFGDGLSMFSGDLNINMQWFESTVLKDGHMLLKYKVIN